MALTKKFIADVDGKKHTSSDSINAQKILVNPDPGEALQEFADAYLSLLEGFFMMSE